MKTVQTVYGVFDTDLGRLVGIAPQGVSDVTFLAGQDTQTVGDPVTALVNPVTGGLEVSAGEGGAILGSLISGQWFNPTSIFRLLCNGTGSITLDSKDASGAVTTGVFSVTLAAAVNQIEFPYAGDGTIQIRATLTGTATAKVI